MRPIDGSEIRMLLDQPFERGVGDASRIEARSFVARTIGAAAAQSVEEVAGFDQQRADFGAGEFALQPWPEGTSPVQRAREELFALSSAGISRLERMSSTRRLR